jgi:hypothetical protein
MIYHHVHMVNEVTNPTASLREVSGWTDTINESVHTSDDQDIGDVEAVNRDFIVVKRGFVNVHRYFIPISKVQGWDGNVLWLSVPEETINANYERDLTPDPSTYYVKGEEDKYTGTQWKKFAKIEPRYTTPTYTAAPRKADEPPVYRCVLCDTIFGTDEEFSRHAAAH